MKMASTLLRVESYQHCIAHSLHLLLTTDGLCRIPELTALLEKCKKIVSVLHFKSLLIDDELTNDSDRLLMYKFAQTMTTALEILELDEQFQPHISDDEEASLSVAGANSVNSHHHVTVKKSCPTRWNSLLNMIDSLLDLSKQVDNVLKKTGNLALCLRGDEVEVLQDLRTFLKPFEELTELVSTTGPTLSLIPLMKLRLKKLCATRPNEDTSVKQLKNLVLSRIDDRLMETESCAIAQILNPDTKMLKTKATAMDLLRPVVERLERRNIILTNGSQSQNDAFQPSDGQYTANDSDFNPAEKRRKMYQELINEIHLAGPGMSQV
jgi:hypothetical protein